MQTSTIRPELKSSYCAADESEPVLEQTIGDALFLAADTWGPRTALVEGLLDERRRVWSFELLRKDAERVARALLGHFAPGENIAICAANSPEWVLIEFGAALAGVTLVTVNPAFQTNELRYALQHSEARGVFVQAHYRGRQMVPIVDALRLELPHLREVVSLDDWADFLATASATRPLPRVQPSDIAQIQYTSGTTGFPKGAELTHRGLTNNARAYARVMGVGPSDVWINPLPMFHTSACGSVTLGALQTGAAHVLSPGFDAAQMLALFEAERGTLMLSVPTMLIRMLDCPDLTKRDLATWRLASLSGAPVPPELVRRAAQTLGLKVSIAFGQTEASPFITETLPDDSHPNWLSSVGRPLPQTEVKIVDTETGETVPLGTVGEICARGNGIMKGYFRDAAGTARALDRDGWLHTGDLGSIDERGYCKVEGRLKDMIIRGGENISPREIEDLLFTHPAVAGVAVVGIPDPEWGEVVAAFVQPRADCAIPTEDELTTFCRTHLSSYKTPRVWRFVEEFPQTASGKIQKFALRDQIASEKSRAGVSK